MATGLYPGTMDIALGSFVAAFMLVVGSAPSGPDAVVGWTECNVSKEKCCPLSNPNQLQSADQYDLAACFVADLDRVSMSSEVVLP